MQIFRSWSFSSVIVFLIMLSFAFNSVAFAQSRTQKSEKPTTDGKKNQRPTPKTEEELRQEEAKRKQEEEDKNAVVDDEVVTVKTNLVNVDAVVYNKKTGQIITGLKKENFAALFRRLRAPFATALRKG